MSTSYEFTTEENQLISKLAQMMRIVGILFLVSGILTIVLSVSKLDLISIGYGAALAVIGYSLLTAATSFKQIVQTEGNDIANLMHALRMLYNACAIQLWALVAVFVLSIIFSFLK